MSFPRSGGPAPERGRPIELGCPARGRLLELGLLERGRLREPGRPSQRVRSFARAALLAAGAIALSFAAGCPGETGAGGTPGGSPNVVVYCAADRELAQDVLDGFAASSRIAVDARWDTEAAKTVGLAQAIEAERTRPRASVFWDNEPLQCILLARHGLLAPLPADLLASAGEAPRDPRGLWLGFAARVRVLLVNTAAVASDAWPRSCADLAAPRFKGHVGVANPLFGTTSTHVAALFAKLGDGPARAWLEGLRANGVAVCAGNADVKNRVASGELWVGLTDTDDAHEAVAAGKSVAVVFPDQEPEGLGALVIPNAVAVTAGAPQPDTAVRLARALASTATETALARGPGQQLPLLPGGAGARPAWIPADLRRLAVSWEAVADAHPAARAAVKSVLLSGQ